MTRPAEFPDEYPCPPSMRCGESGSAAIREPVSRRLGDNRFASPSLTVTCCAPGDALFVGDVISVQAAPSQCLRSARGVTPDSHRTARAAE